MINLLCPLELSPRRAGGRRIDEYENASNSISNSVAESDSIDAESGFEDQEIPDACQVSIFLFFLTGASAKLLCLSLGQFIGFSHFKQTLELFY
jgi:hypothetical protein